MFISINGIKSRNEKGLIRNFYFNNIYSADRHVVKSLLNVGCRLNVVQFCQSK